jgi:hypothetical protein
VALEDAPDVVGVTVAAHGDDDFVRAQLGGCELAVDGEGPVAGGHTEVAAQQRPAHPARRTEGEQAAHADHDVTSSSENARGRSSVSMAASSALAAGP